MKLKEGFMLRNIVGTWVVVPIGERVVDFNGLITLNDSGVLLWKKLELGASKEDLLQVIQEEYEIDKATAKADVEEFTAILNKKGLIA